MTGIKRTLTYLKKYLLPTIGALLSLLLVNAANLYSPKLLQRLVDEGIAALNMDVVWSVVIALFGIAAVSIPRLVSQEFWRGRTVAGIVVLSLALLQFAGLAYNPLWQLPSTEEREASEKLMQFMEQVEGEVFAPGHSCLIRRTASMRTATKYQLCITIS